MQTAEDITHDALLYYWENKDHISADTDILGYILLTIRNKCLNYLKHLQIEADYNEHYARLCKWEIKSRIMTLEDTHYAEIFKNEIMSIITASLEKLPQQTRDIFIQNRMKGKSRKEIAAEMDVSLQKIDYHINKANDHLHNDLKKHFPLIILLAQNIFS
jgi:RNA polymerase sigma-70 factor (ECF subfamily)